VVSHRLGWWDQSGQHLLSLSRSPGLSCLGHRAQRETRHLGRPVGPETSAHTGRVSADTRLGHRPDRTGGESQAPRRPGHSFELGDHGVIFDNRYSLGRLPSILRRRRPAGPGMPCCLWSELWPKRPFRTPNPLEPVRPGSGSSLGSSNFGTLANGCLRLRGLSPAAPISPSCPKNGGGDRGSVSRVGPARGRPRWPARPPGTSDTRFPYISATRWPEEWPTRTPPP
jgi:hypothetical protein